MSEFKLFDPNGHHPINEKFRTTQVFQCYVCGTLTNLGLHSSGPPFGGYFRSICPNGKEKWHRGLEEMIRWLELHPHPRSYRKELEEEIEEIRNLHNHAVTRNDVVGLPIPDVTTCTVFDKPVKIF